MYKIIGFYSHIPFAKFNSNYYTSSFIGRYLEKLSNNTNLLVIGHLENYDKVKYDFEFSSVNIKFYNIGKKRHSLIRFFFGFKTFIFHYKLLSQVDVIIVRAPTPLSFWFKLFFKNKIIKFLLVADEKEGAKNKKVSTFRDLIIKYFNLFSDFVLYYSLKNTNVLVNSKALYNKYLIYRPKLISTSNLIDSDFTKKLNFTFNKPLKLLYVGRIDLTKGVLEILESIHVLKKLGIHCNFDIVGWDDSGNNNIRVLKEKVKYLNITQSVNFCGKKSQGKELNTFYNSSDIFICASYHESFPRTIYESMANSTVVIASSVGSIPLELEHKKNVMLISPKNSQEIVSSIIYLTQNFKERKEIIKNAYELAKTKTLTHSIKGLLNYINEDL